MYLTIYGGGYLYIYIDYIYAMIAKTQIHYVEIAALEQACIRRCHAGELGQNGRCQFGG